MPEDLVAALTEDELIDLVEYLLTLKTAALTPETWHIVGPFANDGARPALDKDLGPEKGRRSTRRQTLDGKDGAGQVEDGPADGDGLRRSRWRHHAGKSPHIVVVPVPRDRVAGRPGRR